MKTTFTLFLLLFLSSAYSQNNFPWERPLKIAWSNDGTTFSNNSIFQDSSGVPSAVKWKGDTLACVFQWFRQPMNSATWDKVSVKFSYDAGLSWTNPTPIIISGMPSNYQRPFDPTLAVISNDSLRIYFSSSNGMPQPGGDSIIDTYSASGTDGIHYTFEPGPRFSHPTGRVIDPGVFSYNGTWHYSAPIGAPQDGAYHCTSSDGINFTQQTNYISDMTHNWTGNFMLNNSLELRFYGSGQHIWYNSTGDGFSWSGYNNTNVVGGDPSVVKMGIGNYLIVYVGEPYLAGVNELENDEPTLSCYPNPFSEFIFVSGKNSSEFNYLIHSASGKLELSGRGKLNDNLQTDQLPKGIYFITIITDSISKIFKLVK